MNDRMPNRASCRVLGSFDEPSNTCDFSVSKVRARRQQGDSPRPIEAVQHVGIAPKSTTVWLNIFSCWGLYDPVWTTFETSITLLRARRIVAVGLKSAKWFSIFVALQDSWLVDQGLIDIQLCHIVNNDSTLERFSFLLVLGFKYMFHKRGFCKNREETASKR